MGQFCLIDIFKQTQNQFLLRLQGMDILQTSLQKCLICKSGDIVVKSRQCNKEGFVIYGRNGARQALHVEKRCNFRNSSFECGAGYFYGYTSYKGMKIISDDALQNPVLVRRHSGCTGIPFVNIFILFIMYPFITSQQLVNFR